MGFLSLQNYHSKLLLFLLTGINPSLIGLFRGMCALMGFTATFLSASIISKLGVLKAGASALVFQASVLAMAVLVYLSNPLGHQGSLVVFLFLIVSQIPIHNS
jgi:hypothetical protein